MVSPLIIPLSFPHIVSVSEETTNKRFFLEFTVVGSDSTSASLDGYDTSNRVVNTFYESIDIQISLRSLNSNTKTPGTHETTPANTERKKARAHQ